MNPSLDLLCRKRPDYARGATLYCKKHMMERARKYFMDEAGARYNQFRYRMSTTFKLPLDGFGKDFKGRRYFQNKRVLKRKAEDDVRGSLQRLAVERKAFARLVTPPRLFKVLMKRAKFLSHVLVRMETNLQKLGLDEGWKPFSDRLEAAMAEAVDGIKARQRENGLASEAYAIKSIAERRRVREMRYGSSGSGHVEQSVNTRGQLVCSACHPEAAAQKSDRPCVPEWWVAMLRGMYRSRADVGLVEKALLNDPEARLCVVYGIVMVAIVREGEEPHFFVLDMEPLERHGSRFTARAKASKGLRARTGRQSRAWLRQMRQERDGNENEPQERRRESSPLSRG